MAKAPKASLLALVLTLLACAWSAVPAFGSAKDVIKDCSEDGILNGHYSHSELAKALAQLPADLDEYTDCRAVIRAAELRSAGKRPPAGPGNVDTASPPSAKEQKKLSDATKSPGQLTIGGKGVTPGASGAPFKNAGFGTNLPTLVLLLLLAMAGAMIAAAVLALRRRYPALTSMEGPIADPIRKLTTRMRDGISRFRR
jgi:hypothetical protein